MYSVRCLVMFLIVVTAADAATFCVGTSSELTNALTIAESNGEDNVIRITQGTYLTNGITSFTYQAEGNQSLTLSGGWYNFSPLPNPCFSQSINPLDTVLDGNNLTKVLHLSNQPNKPNTDITIENITISNGFVGTFSHVFSG